MRTFGAMLVMAVLGWMAGRLWSEPRVEVAAVPAPLPEVIVEAVDVPKVEGMAVPRESRSTRNLFAYRQQQAPPALPTSKPPVRPVLSPQAAADVHVPEPPTLRQRVFPYRYLGRFGPDAKPLAAFSRDGEVLVRRAGESIDDHFVLLAIGTESVEVGEGTQRDARRVPVGEPPRR